MLLKEFKNHLDLSALLIPVNSSFFWPPRVHRLPLHLILSCSSVQFSSVTQLCLTLCDLMDCSSPGSSVHGIFQARILEWVAVSSSRGSSQPMD